MFVYLMGWWTPPYYVQQFQIGCKLWVQFSQLYLFLPSWGSAINMLLTMKGEWQQVAENPLIKFMVLASTFYMFSTLKVLSNRLNQLMQLRTLLTGFLVTYMMVYLVGLYL